MPRLSEFSARRARAWLARGALLLLAACSSTPLPPWPEPSSQSGKAPTAGAPKSPAASANARSKSVPAPLGQAGASQVRVTPVPPSALEAQAPTAPAGAATLPYASAVAAWFPDPGTRYDTPGLAPARQSFTSNAELAIWLEKLAAAPPHGPTRVKLLNLGLSQQGEPLLGLLLTQAKDTDIASLDASGRPTVLLLAQQRGDEPAGAEALLVVARELAQGLLEPLLARIHVIVVPRANPDGAALGQPGTAQGTDLERDHLSLTTPEAQALARLVRDYRPLLVLDAREYPALALQPKLDGIARYDALLSYATTANYPPFLAKAAQQWYYEPITQALRAQGLTSAWYYEPAAQPQDRGIRTGSTLPDEGRNVQGLKNTVSLQVAARGSDLGRAHLQRRVHTLVTAVNSALQSTAERAAELEQVRSFVARETRAQSCRGELVLMAEPTPAQQDLVLLDPRSGAEKKLNVEAPSARALRPLQKRARPCGYWLAASAERAVERLRLLGAEVLRVAEPGTVLAETYAPELSAGNDAAPAAPDKNGATAAAAAAAATTDLAGQPGTGTVPPPALRLRRSVIDAPLGSYYVPLSQSLAPLISAALEPDTPFSYYSQRLVPDLAAVARAVAAPELVFDDSD
ncbi:M14 family metallopeptidase [Extensimonas vulgaris]|uniref:Zinc carboxypeptidase n=1 Tax=Extensimonas vulgaris TaxID=1031594 RepID=A0A369AL01_9BURK|nr:M14 family metallopeptidase [Extensimonas vulgaris]RCX08966.1 zinc carboxypeptidase [Extensimonas vulgaris]TWI37202.1 zinc carboxypeptidase [Extensimonas vulgaris]